MDSFRNKNFRFTACLCLCEQAIHSIYSIVADLLESLKSNESSELSTHTSRTSHSAYNCVKSDMNLACNNVYCSQKRKRRRKGNTKLCSGGSAVHQDGFRLMMAVDCNMYLLKFYLIALLCMTRVRMPCPFWSQLIYP